MKYLLILLTIFISCKLDSNQKNVQSLNKKGEKKNLQIKDIKINSLDSDNLNADEILISSNAFEKILDLSDLITSIELIPLETSNESMFGEITKLLYDSGSYFVFDKRNKKLLRFDNQGKFLNSIGSIGKGPHEVSSIIDVAIDKKNNLISILDAKRRVISKFDFSGKYISSNPIFYGMHQHEYINENIVFSVEKNIKNEQIPMLNSYSLIVSDENQSPIARAFQNPKVSNIITTKNPLRNFNNNVYYHKPYSDGIWEVKKDSLIPLIRFEFEKNGIPKDLWKQNLKYDELTDLILENASFTGNYIITNNLCYFQAHIERTFISIFYSRKSKLIMQGNAYSKGKLLTNILSNPIGAIGDNCFYTTINTSSLRKMKEKHPMYNKVLKRLNDKNIEKLSKIKDTDNPIIIVYKLKDF